MKALQYLVGVALLTVLLMAAVLLFRLLAGFDGYDPYWIDYNRPGVDITSEGP